MKRVMKWTLVLSIGLAVLSCKKDDEPVADNNSGGGSGGETADTTVTDIDGNTQLVTIWS